MLSLSSGLPLNPGSPDRQETLATGTGHHITYAPRHRHHLCTLSHYSGLWFQMNFTPEVEAVSEEAAAAVEVLMSPALPPIERQRTYELCERLKESPLALQCGVYLSASHRPNMVRHLGLQVIENTIKFRWNDLAVDEKVFLKVCDRHFLIIAWTIIPHSVHNPSPSHMRHLKQAHAMCCHRLVFLIVARTRIIRHQVCKLTLYPSYDA